MTKILLNSTSQKYFQITDEFNLEAVDGLDDFETVQLYLIDNSVNVVSVPMPLKQDKQIERTLPFALEEVISTDVDETVIHYLGKANGTAYAMISSKLNVEGFYNNTSLETLCFTPAFLPFTDDSITLVLIGDTALVRAGQFEYFSIPSVIVDSAISSIMTRSNAIKTLNVCNLTPEKKGEIDTLLLAQLQNLDLTINISSNHDVLEGIIKNDPKKLSFFKGDYKRIKKKSKAKFNKFKLTAGLFACLLLLFITTLQINKTYTESKAAAVQNASIEFYKKLFPNEKVRARLMRRQFNDYLENNANPSANGVVFTSLLADTAKIIKTFKGIELDSIKYSEKKHILEIALTCKSVNELDLLKQRMGDNNLKVEISSANQSGKLVKGIIKVQSNA